MQLWMCGNDRALRVCFPDGAHKLAIRPPGKLIAATRTPGAGHGTGPTAREASHRPSGATNATLDVFARVLVLLPNLAGARAVPASQATRGGTAGAADASAPATGAAPVEVLGISAQILERHVPRLDSLDIDP